MHKYVTATQTLWINSVFLWAICWTNCSCFNASAHSEISKLFLSCLPKPWASVREPSTHWSRQDKTVKTLITAMGTMESFHVLNETLFDVRTLLPKKSCLHEGTQTQRTSGSHYHKRFSCYKCLRTLKHKHWVFLFSAPHVSQSMEFRWTFFLDTVLPLCSALPGVL